MATRKRKKQRTPEPESELLRRARESTIGQPLISQFISIRPNGTSFPSKIVPFKPLVGSVDASRWNVPMDAPNTNNFRQILSQSNAPSSSSNMLPMPSTVLSATQPFKSVFAISSSSKEEKQASIVAMNKIMQEEGNAAIPTLEDDENDVENDEHFPSMEIQCVQCEMSDLQKDLYGAIDYLMSLNEQEQHNLKVQLFNHPCLLFARIQQLSAPFANKATGKKARAQWVSYSNVLSQFPTRYESMHQCHIEESGKLLKLFQILVESARDDDAQNPARLIVASSFSRTLNLIADLMDQVNAKLNYSVYSFTPNMPSTTRHWDLGRAMGDVGRKLILLNTKTENLPTDFFTGAHLIFFDFDKTNDGKLSARWNVAGVERVQRLATTGTFETE